MKLIKYFESIIDPERFKIALKGCQSLGCGGKYKIVGNPGRFIILQCLRCGRLRVLDGISNDKDRILKIRT